MRAKRSCRERGHGLTSLPPDLLVELVVHVASRSSTPLADVMNLRASCKSFLLASKGRKVGRCMPVGKEWALHWWNRERFIALLRSCAETGNPEACFLLGVEETYNLRRKSAGLHHLQLAMAGGHHVAAYLMGMILFRDPATRSLGVKLLNKLEPDDDPDATAIWERSKRHGNRCVELYRREARSVLRKMTWARWSLQPRLPCANQLCGRVATREGVDQWSDESMHRSFCSQLCRWTDEYYRFFERI